MKTCLRFIALIFHVGIMANTAFALDVFVSTSAQLKTACENATRGNVINIAAGSYNGPFILSGKSNVTLQSYNGTVILMGKPNPNVGGIDILTIINSSNIKVLKLKFAENWGNDANGISVHGFGKKLEISNCEFYNIGWGKDKTIKPTPGQNAHAIIIVGDTATSYSNISITANSIHDCITGYSEILTLTGNVKDFQIDGNFLHDNTNIGIDCAGHYSWTKAPANVNYARNGIIKNNRVYNYAGPDNFPAGAGIYVDGGSLITIHNNRIYNYKVGISIGCENPGKSNSGNIVRDNIIYNNALAGIFVGSSISSSIVNNTKLTNNTFYKNGFGQYDNGQIALLNNAGTIIKNNILYPTNGRFAVVQMNNTTTSNVTIRYNLYYRDNGDIKNLYYNVPGDNNSIKSNPLFVSAPIDLHLKQTSPAINHGDPGFVAGSGETDIDGQARILDNRVDIGADEVALTIPNAPSALAVSTISYAILKLNWMDNANNETGFKIERSTGNSTTFTQIATAGIGVTSYTDDGLAYSTKYNYRVRAYNTAGNSAYTQVASGTTTGIGTLSIDKNAQASTIKTSLYPNPVSDILTLSLKEASEEAMISISDIKGNIKLVKKYNDLKQQQLQFDVNELKPGEYILQLKTGKSIETFKLVKL